MPREYKGTFKVRRVAKTGQQTIAVPSTVSGEYSLYIDEAGVMTFEPIGVRV